MDILSLLMGVLIGISGGTLLTAIVYTKSFERNPQQWALIIWEYLRRAESKAGEHR